jgi:hypothetical protein
MIIKNVTKKISYKAMMSCHTLSSFVKKKVEEEEEEE